MSRGKDFLDELIEESTKKDPRFPELLAEAIARRELAKQLVAARTEKGLFANHEELAAGRCVRPSPW
ncbi:MAG: hypothetical protein IPI49_19950 [Myxococcales bacterium]|nr:hypothetical protein [Myxococcales bacterium]